jgi:DNA-binding response OmpR family regulator
MRLFLVDDEYDTCMSYQMVLQDAGYECKSYIDSVRELKEFRPSYYDICLLDIKMPMLNGFDLCKKIREVDKAIHVIFITAAAEYYSKFRNQHHTQLDTTNTSYIQKPIANQDLIKIITKTIATKNKN